MKNHFNKNLIIIEEKEHLFQQSNSPYPYEYMDSFERFNEKKLPARKYIFRSTKNEKMSDDGKN